MLAVCNTGGQARSNDIAGPCLGRSSDQGDHAVTLQDGVHNGVRMATGGQTEPRLHRSPARYN
jgi:hypothetical protein